MVDYADSSQLHQWLYTPEQLLECRTRANRKARLFLVQQAETDAEKKKAAAAAAVAPDDPVTGDTGAATDATTTTKPPPMADYFAYGYHQRQKQGDSSTSSMNNEAVDDPATEIPETLNGKHAFLTPQEEASLVTFYAAKLPKLIGPGATLSRLRRESKVTATAVLLYRRFFLSNSVMIFDPKAVMVAAAFLASKVEDVMVADVRYLEDGTQAMNAHVSQQEILPAELALLQGCHFDLVCFHPFKGAVALTEDLRTFLKSEKGKACLTWIGPLQEEAAAPAVRPISGNDLKPLYEAAREILDDYIGSDLPLLYSPGQVGLATLMVGQEELLAQNKQQFRIDWMQYLNHRFVNENKKAATTTTDDDTIMTDDDQAAAASTATPSQEFWTELCDRLRALKQGEYGCGNYDTPQTSLAELKGIHKKLKKVRYWGSSSSGSSKKDSKKKKKTSKTTKTGDGTGAVPDGADSSEPAPKRVKTE